MEVGVVEFDAVCGEAGEVRGGDGGVVPGHVRPAQVVGNHQQDVGRLADRQAGEQKQQPPAPHPTTLIDYFDYREQMLKTLMSRATEFVSSTSNELEVSMIRVNWWRKDILLTIGGGGHSDKYHLYSLHNECQTFYYNITTYNNMRNHNCFLAGQMPKITIK